LTQQYEVYFRRPDDAVVYAAVTGPTEVSLVHRNADGSWHCSLCNATECHHVEAARNAKDDEAA
jgi:hypothetical protein